MTKGIYAIIIQFHYPVFKHFCLALMVIGCCVFGAHAQTDSSGSIEPESTTDDNIRHHVIVTVDMAGCTGWNGEGDVSKALITDILSRQYEGTERPLFTDGDMFSMLGFAVNEYTADMNMYALPRGASSPITYQSWEADQLQRFLSRNYSKAVKQDRTGRLYSLVSVAKPYTLRALHNDTASVNRTFIVMVTDHHYNGGDFYDEVSSLCQMHEHNGNSTRINQEAITKPCYEVEQNYFMRWMATDSLYITRPRNPMYKPDGYVEVYEAVPLQGSFTLGAAIDYPERVTAQRLKSGGYSIELPMAMREGVQYSPERIEVAVGEQKAVLGKDFTKETLRFVVPDKKQADINIRAWLRLRDGFYEATVMSPENGASAEAGREGLNRRVSVDFEPSAKILSFISLPTWMWRLTPCDNQHTAAAVYSLLLILLLLLWLFLFIRHKIKNPPTFEPRLEDFQYELIPTKNMQTNQINMNLGDQSRVELDVPLELTAPKEFHWFKTQKIPEGKFELQIKINGIRLVGEGDCELKFKDGKAPIVFNDVHDLVGNGDKMRFDLAKNQTKTIRLFFNTDAVETCNLLDRDRTYEIKYQLSLYDHNKKKSLRLDQLKKGENSASYDGERNLTLTIKKFEAEPVFEVVLDPDALKPLRYNDSTIPVKIGQIRLRHNSVASCVPPIKMIEWKLGSAIATTEGIKQTRNIFRLKDNFEGAALEELSHGQSKSFELYYIPKETENPIDIEGAKELNLLYLPTIEYIVNGDETWMPGLDGLPGITIQGNLNVCMFQATLLAPSLNKAQGEPYDIIDNSRIRLNDIDLNLRKHNFGTQKHGVEVKRLDFIFENAAPVFNYRTSVLIWDISLDVKIDQEHLSRLVLADKVKDLKDAFKLQRIREVDGHKELSEFDDKGIIRLYGGNNPQYPNKLVLRMALDPSNFKDIETASDLSYIPVTITVKWTKRDDPEGEFSQKDPQTSQGYSYSCDISFNLRKKPNEEWLSIDFGTSAIVARYGSDEINLKKHKQRLYSAAYPGDKSKSLVEEADPLINSNICFNSASKAEIAFDEIDDITATTSSDTSGIHVANLKNLPIWLSPTKHTLDKKLQLPCLKLLVGYDYLPRIFAEKDLTQNFIYGIKDDGTHEVKHQYLCDKVGNDLVPTELMKVETIFTQIYRQLFGYYIKQTTTNDINRLVLSVPNTYSPVQNDLIKKIAFQAIPTLYPEYLTLVSESDAVAYFYTYHQSDFHKSLSADDPRRKKEKVLIYDMGAGTLDLTYFTIEHKDDGKVEVNIISKSGIVKAGNYLDYVLAKIFIRLIQEKEISTRKDELEALISTDETTSSENDRMLLRDYIRNVVKPLVAKGEDEALIPNLDEDMITQLAGDGGGFKTDYEFEYGEDDPKKGTSKQHLSVSDFVNAPEFKEYIDHVAGSYIVNFARDVKRSLDNVLDIDTIIFSGRSSCMSQVRNKVKETIDGMMVSEEFRNEDFSEVMYASLADRKLSLEPIIKTSNPTVLKNVVSEGTMAYADICHTQGSNYTLLQKDIYAKYGIVATSTQMKDPIWIPLLDAETTLVKKNGKYTLRTEVPIDVRHRKIMLVETYDAMPEQIIRNAEKFDTKVMDSFTVLFSDSLETCGNIEIILEIAPQGKNQITIQYNGSEIPLNSIFQDFSSDSLRTSLWPIVYKNSDTKK